MVIRESQNGNNFTLKLELSKHTFKKLYYEMITILFIKHLFTRVNEIFENFRNTVPNVKKEQHCIET